MAYSMAFHMLFAAVGVGMPFLMFIAEGMWLKTKDERYLRLAKTWAKATGILFAIGAVSGTGLAFQLGLLWPEFMGFAGSTIGPAFTMEGYAFFMEAIFLGIYLYGWNRVSPMAHWLSGAVVALSGAASSVLVVASNAWMQNPIGAELLKTDPEAVTAAVLFANPAWPLMALHSTLACYVAASFAVAGVYGWGALKGRLDPLRQAALTIAMGVGMVTALLMPITGHASAIDVAERQPLKLAAMEAQFHTEKGAPLRIGGIPNMETGEVSYAIEIPYALSILAFNDPHAEVAGLDQFPADEWPNVPLVHYAFQVMVGAGMAAIGVGAWYWWRRRKGEDGVLKDRWLQWALVIGSPLGYIALEAGWMVTEIGRQPWIIYGVMRTSEAASTNDGMMNVLFGFMALYAFLAVVLVFLLRRLKHA